MDIEFRMFLGWAIHSLIDLCCKKKNFKENEAKLEFLRNLRMLEKSFTNENRESASRIWKTLNKGGLCYPKDELRDFGVTILNTIAANMNVDAYGNDAISIVHAILYRDISELKNKWDSAISSIEMTCGLKFDGDISRRVMADIISKVLHARANVFIKAYRERTTSRNARSKSGGIASDVNFRTGLKIQAKPKISSSMSTDITLTSNSSASNINSEGANKKQKIN
jgi:hypothetical protein